MEFRDLAAVVSLADAGGYPRAAPDLGIDVSTLSRRIQRIEEELGVLIFERGRRGILLTSGGRELLCLAPVNGGRIVATHVVHEQGLLFVAAALGRLTGPLKFTADNDLYGEHDFGSFQIASVQLFWKIAYFDQTLTSAAIDPADAVDERADAVAKHIIKQGVRSGSNLRAALLPRGEVPNS